MVLYPVFGPADNLAAAVNIAVEIAVNTAGDFAGGNALKISVKIAVAMPAGVSQRQPAKQCPRLGGRAWGEKKGRSC